MQTKRPGRGAAREYVLVKVPVEHKQLAESMQSLVNTMVAVAGSNSGGRTVNYAETERVIAEQTAAVEREVHAGLLRALDATSDESGSEAQSTPGSGASRARTSRWQARSWERAAYRQVGVRNGPILDPIRLRTGA
ncbi:MAG: hypothetical protein H6718_00145 [Polyangiaceae bacterium]|nr:hypothetical protein [Polyangiaceae bacterium]